MARDKPSLPVLEFDYVGLPTVSVAIKDKYDIEQIVYAVRKARSAGRNKKQGKFDFKLEKNRDEPSQENTRTPSTKIRSKTLNVS